MLSPVLRGRDFPKKTEGKEEGGRTKWEGYNIKERKRKKEKIAKNAVAFRLNRGKTNGCCA